MGRFINVDGNMKDTLNPTPRSPKDISKDPTYEVFKSARPASFKSEYVVKHVESGTYWMTAFALDRTYTDINCKAEWVQVEPKQTEVIEYVKIQNGKVKS